MQSELSLTKAQMGYAFSAFGLAYALFEIPGGWLNASYEPLKSIFDHPSKAKA